MFHVETSLLLACAAAAHGASTASSGTPPAGLATGLVTLVDGAGGLYNTSFSVGVVGSFSFSISKSGTFVLSMKILMLIQMEVLMLKRSARLSKLLLIQH